MRRKSSAELQPPNRRSISIARILASRRFKSQLLTLLIRVIPLQRRIIRVLGSRRWSTIVVVMMLCTSILSSLVAEDCECKVGSSNGDEDEQNREDL
jgi:hypothetical protein